MAVCVSHTHFAAAGISAAVADLSASTSPTVVSSDKNMDSCSALILPHASYILHGLLRNSVSCFLMTAGSMESSRRTALEKEREEERRTDQSITSSHTAKLQQMMSQ